MTPWWQHGSIYHIYPRSFQDSNGDGIGDLNGIRQRLDYLQWLGVDAIWLSPIFPSPMADFGYDVSDFCAIHPIFGTLDDFDQLLEAAHTRDLRVILDFVPNHSSDQHAWFTESRSSRDNPRRDWYIWRDPAPDGGPPNNWISRFGGRPAWTLDERSGQYYLHSFLPEQPDLNWRNPELRAAMLDVLRFWFDRGVDGFRVDVAYRAMKDPQLRDNPPNPDWQPGMDPYNRLLDTYSKNIPETHEFNRWLRAVVDEYPERVLIGELTLPPARLVMHYGQNDEFHLPFNFNLIFTPWQAERIRALADEYESVLPVGAWPNWVLSNHDRARFATRAGAAQARNGQLLLLTLRGTPTLYYGDELGLENVPIPPGQVQDPWEREAPGIGLGRDPVRTPMQWSSAANGEFCPPEVQPWLPLAKNYAMQNVERMQSNPLSILSLTRQLLALRRKHPALSLGNFRSLPAAEDVFAYERSGNGERFVIVLNFSHEPCEWQPPEELTPLDLVLSTELDLPDWDADPGIRLRPDEGLLLRIE